MGCDICARGTATDATTDSECTKTPLESQPEICSLTEYPPSKRRWPPGFRNEIRYRILHFTPA